MKKKLIALWHKIKTVKKRVWAILSALLVIVLVVTAWNSLSYETKREIKARLGNIEAKRDIAMSEAFYNLLDICHGKRSMSRAEYVFNSYAQINELDTLLEWATATQSEMGCNREQVRELAEIARSVLKKKFEVSDYYKWFYYPALEDFIEKSNKWRRVEYYPYLALFYAREHAVKFSISGSYFKEVLARIEQDYIAIAETENYGWSISKNLHKLADSIKKITSDFDDDLIRLYRSAFKLDKNNKWAQYKIAELTLKNDPQNQEALNTIDQLARENYSYALVFLGDRARRYIAIIPYNMEAMRYYTKAAREGSTVGRYEAYERLFTSYGVQGSTDVQLLALLEQRDEYAVDYLDPQVFDFIINFNFTESDINYIVYQDIFVAEQIGRILLLKKKYEPAEQFFQKIVRETNSSTVALSKLGDIYYQGLGRRQELEKAHDYYGKACDLKDQYACDKYQEVNEKIYRAESKR